MCEPVTLVSLGISAASAAASAYAQKKQADDQAHYQNEMFRQAGNSASESYRNVTANVATRLVQNDVQAGQAHGENAVNAMAARAHAAAAAGEAGVSGASLDALLGDFSRIEAANNNTITTNQEWATAQAGQEERGAAAEARSRIAAATPGPVKEPNYAGLALEVGAAGFKAWDQHERLQRQGSYDQNDSTSGWSKQLKIFS